MIEDRRVPGTATRRAVRSPDRRVAKQTNPSRRPVASIYYLFLVAEAGSLLLYLLLARHHTQSRWHTQIPTSSSGFRP